MQVIIKTQFILHVVVAIQQLPVFVLATDYDNTIQPYSQQIQQGVVPKIITQQQQPTTTTHSLLRSSESSSFNNNNNNNKLGVEAKTDHHHNTLRFLQQQNSTTQQNDNTAAAYLKCYSLLDDATLTTNGIMTQTEYLEFLLLMTDGMINYNNFGDLSALYVMIFYVAACTITDSSSSTVVEVQNCAPGIVPQIMIGNTNDPNSIIQFMCQQTLKSITSTAEIIFEYTIRYSTSVIVEEDLATCLSTAVVNVLLNDLANCSPLTNVDTDNDRRNIRQQTRRQMVHDDHIQQQQQPRQVQQQETSLGSAMTDDTTMCDYQISSSVERFTELPCNPSIPGMEGTPNERCGLVRAKAVVTAPQIYEPFDTLLRSQMVTILRTVIDNGSLTTFFPPGTCPIA